MATSFSSVAKGIRACPWDCSAFARLDNLPSPMLDPRIYRAGLVAVVLAVILFAFALQVQRPPLSSTLSPYAFSGQNAYANTVDLSRHYARRPAGSAADQALARVIARRLRGYGYAVFSQRFKAATPAGTRTLQNVVAIREGLWSPAIVVVAHRDAQGSPAVAQQSGTGVLLEVARVLSGETLNRTIVLVSTSGSTGAAGAAHLAATLARPIDAVLVLGDMGGARLRRPLVVPWSDGSELAPSELRNTAAAALHAQAGLNAGSPSLPDQLVHLAFPLTLTEQGPFATHGIAAVLLSTSGERPPSRSEPVSSVVLNQFGRSALQTINALDSGPRVAGPLAYLSFYGEQLPELALSLLVLALIFPVAATALDGLARARRRGYAIAAPMLWVVATAGPFLAVLAIIIATGAAGLLDFAPPGPVGPGVVPLHTGGVVLLALLGAVVVGSVALLVARGAVGVLTGSASRQRKEHAARSPEIVNGHTPRSRRAETVGNPGAVAAILILSCALVLVVWSVNPFAALLLVPALHLWMVAMAPNARIPRGLRVALLALGLTPPALLVTYYALTLHFGPISLAWAAVLMVAGGQVSIPVAVLLCLLAGCGLSASVNVLAGARGLKPARPQTAITLRGPATYAGPGSLGGTPSALPRAGSALRR